MYRLGEMGQIPISEALVNPMMLFKASGDTYLVR